MSNKLFQLSPERFELTFPHLQSDIWGTYYAELYDDRIEVYLKHSTVSLLTILLLSPIIAIFLGPDVVVKEVMDSIRKPVKLVKTVTDRTKITQLKKLTKRNKKRSDG